MDERKKTKLRRWLRVLLIATLCLIWGNSLLPGKESGEISSCFFTLLTRLGIPVPDEHFLRKAAHFCEFALLGAELAGLFWLRGGLRLQRLCCAASAALGAAMIDESIQLFTPNRCPRLADVLLDFSGALTGIALCALALRWLGKRRKDIRQQ